MEPEQDGGSEQIREPPELISYPDVVAIGSGSWDLGTDMGAGRFIGGL
jgi:hypothetical protein